MKKIYTFCLTLFAGAAFAQVPTNFGSNAEDGISYQQYNLIDHGAVSSVRFQAQNTITEGDGTWEFYTGDYMNNWRPYTADDTLSGFDAMIDPSAETASARYNSAYGGQTGKLPAIQAGYYYTCIVGNNTTADNFMSIIETDFDPVVIDTSYVTPTNPTTADNITITVELNGALMPNVGEHVFIRSSIDGYASSIFTEVVNFSNGVGSISIPAGTVPAGTTVNYYVLVTEEADPTSLDNVDFYTLFFGNNNGDNYEFTVTSITGIEEVVAEYDIVVLDNTVQVRNAEGLSSVELIVMDGRLVRSIAANGVNSLNVHTDGLAEGAYVLNLISGEKRVSTKVAIR